MALGGDRAFDMLSIGTVGVFWDALWLEPGPFLCFMLEYLRTMIWRPETIENSIEEREIVLSCGVLLIESGAGCAPLLPVFTIEVVD